MYSYHDQTKPRSNPRLIIAVPQRPDAFQLPMGPSDLARSAQACRFLMAAGKTMTSFSTSPTCSDLHTMVHWDQLRRRCPRLSIHLVQPAALAALVQGMVSLLLVEMVVVEVPLSCLMVAVARLTRLPRLRLVAMMVATHPSIRLAAVVVAAANPLVAEVAMVMVAVPPTHWLDDDGLRLQHGHQVVTTRRRGCVSATSAASCLQLERPTP